MATCAVFVAACYGEPSSEPCTCEPGLGCRATPPAPDCPCGFRTVARGATERTADIALHTCS